MSYGSYGTYGSNGYAGNLSERRPGNLARRQATGLVERPVERFVFLIDISGSMRPLAKSFPKQFGELLDSLAASHPDAVASVVLFNEAPAEQYWDEPIATAPAIQIRPHHGTDLPNAIITGIRIDELGEGDTLVILTDGDVENHHSRHKPYEAMHAMARARCRGLKFLLYMSGDGSDDLRRAVQQAGRIGITEAEVRTWDHSVQGLGQAFQEASNLLCLPASR